MNFAVCQLIFVCLTLFPSAGSAGRAQLSGCNRIEADGLFSFCLPAGFNKTDMAGVEHYLGEYYKGRTRFFFLWGDTASNAYDDRRDPEMENYEESQTTIDGRQANLRSYSKLMNGNRLYHVELNVGDWKNGKVILYMDLETTDPHDIAMAKQIFNSVKLLKA